MEKLISMKGVFLLVVFLVISSWVSSGFELKSEHVAVVYNSKSPHGKELAEEYAKLRNIPKENMVELNCSVEETVSRKEFNDSIRDELRDTAFERGWWTPTGRPLDPIVNRKIYSLVLMMGVPMKVAQEGEAKNGMLANAASVDSELALLAFDDVPVDGMIGNAYYNKESDIVGSGLPYFLVTRIDAPDRATCLSMMHDAVDVEKRGLWGWLAVDWGGPYPEGNAWLDRIVLQGMEEGVPVNVDLWGETYPSHYPMSNDTAVYFGWYAWNANGPFLEAGFRFRRGAVAVHLHSFSASTVRSDKGAWAGPLLSKGAAVTAGNVYEPYLSTSLHFDVFYDRLMKGYTVAEAAGMSIPIWSWQNVIFGDPLYRPFAALSKGKYLKTQSDKYFQAWRVARQTWKDDPASLNANLEAAAEKPAGALFFFEAMANKAMQEKDWARAEKFLARALVAAVSSRDKIRIRLSMAEMMRRKGDQARCLAMLKVLMADFPQSVWTPAIAEWKTRLEPPPSAEKPKQKKPKN